MVTGTYPPDCETLYIQIAHNFSLFNKSQVNTQNKITKVNSNNTTH